MQQITKNNFKIFILIIGICLGFRIYDLGFVKEVLAQQNVPFVVAPSRQTVAIDPGKSESLQIRFFNESETAISGNLKVVDFVVTAKDGAPILLEDQINPYVKLPYDRATIAKGDVLRVNFTVAVPQDAEPGGRYAAIIFEPVGQLPEALGVQEEASFVSPRIVGLVNIKINGPVYESAFVDIFKMPGFLEFGPVPVYFEILNKGGYHVTPTGQLTLTNWLGKEVARETLESKNIFPNAKRTYEAALGKTFMFGRYTVGLEAAYGEQGKTLGINKYVWVIPVTLIMIILLGTVAVILGVILITNKIKSKQVVLEEKLEQEISDLENLKMKFKDKLPK